MSSPASLPALPGPPVALGTLMATVLSLGLVLAWDVGGLDLPLAHLAGDLHGFGLRDSPGLTHVLHDGARRASWVLLIALCVGIWWPFLALRRLPIERRVQWVVSGLLSVLMISLLKSISRTSCPWDLSDFGGVARHLSHWSLGQTDGGPGRCFPAGHASAGFAFIGGYFACRRDAPGAARIVLVASLAGGTILGVAQQVRGAHFMSHTLWTGWLCWVLCWGCASVVDIVMERRR